MADNCFFGTNLFTQADFNPNVKIALKDENDYAALIECNDDPNTNAQDLGVYKNSCICYSVGGSGFHIAINGSADGDLPVWELISTGGTGTGGLSYSADNTLGSIVISPTQMVDAILDRNGGSINRADTTDTAANLITQIPGVVVGSTFNFYYRNTSGTAGETLTLSGGTGVTISGGVVVASGATRQYIGRVTALGGSPTIILDAVSVATGTVAGTAAGQTFSGTPVSAQLQRGHETTSTSAVSGSNDRWTLVNTIITPLGAAVSNTGQVLTLVESAATIGANQYRYVDGTHIDTLHADGWTSVTLDELLSATNNITPAGTNASSALTATTSLT